MASGMDPWRNPEVRLKSKTRGGATEVLPPPPPTPTLPPLPPVPPLELLLLVAAPPTPLDVELGGSSSAEPQATRRDRRAMARACMQ